MFQNPKTTILRHFQTVMATDEIIGTYVVVSNKLFKFEGIQFKCWKQKMWFLLGLKRVVNDLTDDIPIVPSEWNKLTNIKKSIDLDGITNSDELESTAQIKEITYSWRNKSPYRRRTIISIKVIFRMNL